MDLSESKALIVPPRQPVAVFSPHPLQPARDRELVHAEFLPRETLGTYLERTGIAARIANRHVVVSINGLRVPRSVWVYTRPKPGTLIEIRAIVKGGGGGGGKNPIASVLSIALLAAAPYLAGYALTGTWAAAAGFTGSLLTVGIGVVGALAINSLFPPPKPQLSNAAGLPAVSPTYSLSGGSNRARPFEPMPKMLGVHRVFPDAGAQTYTEFEGDDQVLHQVFDLGYNDIDLSDFKIGATPIENFSGVQIQVSGPDGKLDLFPGNVDSQSGAALSVAGGAISRTSSPDATRLAVDITGSLYYAGSGGISGRSVVIQLDYRAVGAPAWTSLQFASDAAPEIVQPGTTGFLAGFARMYASLIDTAGLGAGQIRITSDTRVPLRRTFAWNVPQGQYEVRVQRITADETDPQAISEIAWSQLRTYQPDTADYTSRKRIALKITASGQLNGQVDQLSCIARAKCATFGEGYALQFDQAASQYVNTTELGSLASQYFSAEAWLTLTAQPTGAGGGYALSCARDTSPVSGGWHVKVNRLTNNLLGQAWGATSGTLKSTPAVALVIGVPTHVVLTLDGANLSLYVNGVLAAQVAMAEALLAPAYALKFASLGFTPLYFFPGAIDGVRVYARALSVGEIAEHYQGVFRDDTDLVGKWEFDEGMGVTAIDSSGNGNDGTLVNGPAYVANPQTWGVRYTSNPAWWYQDVAAGKLVGGRRVWGAGLAGSRIDSEGLKDFAAWCESKGLTFNGVFDQPITAGEMLNAIALCGRGSPTWAPGKLGVVWDAGGQPFVAVFGMPNIIRDSFEIEYLTANLADEVVLSFINPDLDWQRDTVRATVPGKSNPSNPTSVELIGCTDKAMAGTAVNLYAAANAYRIARRKWLVDWEGMPIARGDVVKLSHDLASFDYSGRLIEGGDASTLKLDRTVPLDPAGGFVTLVKPDGSFATYDVAGGSGNVDTLTLTAPLAFNPCADANHPPYDYRWLFGASATPGKLVKIEKYEPSGAKKIQLTAIDEVDAYYASESSAFTYTPPVRRLGQVQLSNLALTEDGVRAANGYLVKVTATWDAQGDYGYAEVRASVNGGPLALVDGNLRGRSASITVSDGSDVIFDVTGYSSLGRLGGSSHISLAQTIGFSALFPPSDVTGFDLTGGTFRWDEAPDVDVVGQRIRFHYGARTTWADAAPLQQGLLSKSPDTPPALPSGPCAFGIVHVDAAGRESTTPSWIITQLGDQLVANVVETIDFKAEGFPGTLTGGAIVGGDLEATNGTAFYTASDAGPFYSSNDTDPFYPAAVYDTMVYETTSFAPSGTQVGSNMTLDATVQGDPVFVEYRPIGASTPLYAASDADPFYAASDADPFYDPAPEYSAWPGQVAAKGIALQFRVTTGQGNTQGIVSTMTLTIDVPDVAEHLDNVSIDPAGTRLPIANTYSTITTVQGTLAAGTGAVSIKIEDKNATLGPLITARDAADTAIAASGDFDIQGY